MALRAAAAMLMVSAVVSGTAEAEVELGAPRPEAAPAAARALPLLDPAQWCRPVVNAAIDPDPLACWLHLTADTPTGPPSAMVGMNLGELPPWSTLDVDAIGAEIVRYEALIAEELEQRRIEESRPPRRPAPARTTRTTSESNAGKSDDQLAHECFDLRIASSCGTLADRHLAAGEGGGGAPEPGPAPAPAPASPEESELYDFSQHDGEHQAWREGIERQAQEQLDAQCPGGGRATWYSDGSIFVTCY